MVPGDKYEVLFNETSDILLEKHWEFFLVTHITSTHKLGKALDDLCPLPSPYSSTRTFASHSLASLFGALKEVIQGSL